MSVTATERRRYNVCLSHGWVLSVFSYEAHVSDLGRCLAPPHATPRGGQAVRLSASAEERADRRLLWNKSGRSVPRSGKCRRRRDQEMDRGGEQTHFRLFGDDSGAEQDQGQDDRALELREIHGPVS